MKRLAWASLLLFCVSPVVYLQETNGQKEDIVFETDNTNAKPFDKIEFIVNINDMATNKKVCQSGNCTIEVIEMIGNIIPTGLVMTPNPVTQRMNSG